MIVVVKEFAQNGAIWSQSFLTVITGVLVFVISQIIIYGRIKPHQAYLDAASELSSEMLQVTNKFTNFHLNESEVDRIRRANARYLAASKNSGFGMRRKEIRKNGFEVAQNINVLIFLSIDKQVTCDKVSSLNGCMKKIEELDKNILIKYINTRD